MQTPDPIQTCEALRERLTSGTPDVVAHLETCAACRAVAAAQAPEEDADARFDALFERVAEDAEAERGARAWLRSRPTWQRRLAVGGGAALTAALTLLLWGRVDLAHYPTERLAAELGALGGLLAVALVIGLRRGPHPAGRVALLGALGLGLLAPWLAGALPMAHEAHAASLVGAGDDLLRRAVACLVWGSAAALPTLAVMLLAMRDGGGATAREALLGLVAGLAGVLALQLHCPITQPVHLLLGHAPVGVVLVVAWLALRRLARRR